MSTNGIPNSSASEDICLANVLFALKIATFLFSRLQASATSKEINVLPEPAGSSIAKSDSLE